MKSRIEVIKELVKKYPNNYQLGSIIRQYIMEDYWKPVNKVDPESEWLKQLSEI
jgi:hypothetical protein